MNKYFVPFFDLFPDFFIEHDKRWIFHVLLVVYDVRIVGRIDNQTAGSFHDDLTRSRIPFVATSELGVNVRFTFCYCTMFGRSS